MMTPIGPTDAFSFLHDGRTFRCCVEAAAQARGQWWWFSVSNEPHQRHAPFPHTATDTPDSVRGRIVEYHDALLARRAAPPQNRWQGRARQTPAAAPATAVATPGAVGSATSGA